MGAPQGKIRIRVMDATDYPQVIEIWHRVEGVCVGEGDSEAEFQRFLKRNPGLSFVAEVDESVGDVGDKQIVGTLLAGHDGRRGYLHHLAVLPGYRHKGIARGLVDQSLQALKSVGIQKCHLFVLKENEQALDFWERLGWQRRDELHMFSKNLS